jgi:zinc protease
VKDGEHFERLTRLGATATNAVTEDASTTYLETVPARALETALWLESDRMGFALGGLTEAHFLVERQILENEEAQRTSLRPYGAIGTEIDRALHGTRGSARQIQFEDVPAFVRDWYRPNNATITLVGNFDREEAKGWIEKYFGPIVRGDLPTRVPHHASWESRGPLRLEAGVPLAYALLAWPLNVDSGQGECDRLLVNNALRSFFFNQLRDGRAPVSDVTVSGDDAGLFLSAMGLEGTNADELVQFLQESTKRFRATDDDFHAARRATLTNFLSSLATIEGRSASYSSWGYNGYASGIVSGIFDGVNESSARRMNLWFDDVRKNSPLAVVVSPKVGAPIAGRRVDAAAAQ